VQVCAYQPSLFSLDMDNVISTLYRTMDTGDDTVASQVEKDTTDLIEGMAFR
jgi:hypothetical protein